MYRLTKGRKRTTGPIKSLLKAIYDIELSKKNDSSATRSRGSIHKMSMDLNSVKETILPMVATGGSDVGGNKGKNQEEQFEFINAETRNKKNWEMSVRDNLLKSNIVCVLLFCHVEKLRLCSFSEIQDLEGS